MSSLDQRIPTKNNVNNIKTDFESFFYRMQKHTKNPDQELQDELKTCENYSKVIVLYTHQEIIDKLPRNTDILILRQGKGRGIATLDCKDCIQKCVSILSTSQFRKIRH